MQEIRAAQAVIAVLGHRLFFIVCACVAVAALLMLIAIAGRSAQAAGGAAAEADVEAAPAEPLLPPVSSWPQRSFWAWRTGDSGRQQGQQVEGEDGAPVLLDGEQLPAAPERPGASVDGSEASSGAVGSHHVPVHEL